MSMKKPITISIHQVAKEAGVSIKTVSRVINNHPDVAPATRQRVQEVIDQLDYRPNASAQGLRARQTNTIAFIILHYQTSSMFAEAFLANIIAGIIDSLVPQDYHLLIYPVPDGDENRLRTLFNSRRVDGVIVQQGYPNDPMISLIADAHIPVAYIGLDEAPHTGSVNVTTDFAVGTRLAVRHLVERGHRHIGHIRGDVSWSSGAVRVSAFKDELLRQQLLLREDWICGEGWSRQHGAEAMQQLLNLPERPTGIVAACDMLAIGAMEVIRSHGLRIPEDIALVGFDDIFSAGDLFAPLTTIRTSFYDFGKEAAANLLRLLNAPDSPPQQIILPCELIIRKST